VFISREETLNGIRVLALILSMIGCYLAVSGGSWEGIRLSGWSMVSGILSSLCYAFMLLISKYLLKKYTVWTMLLYAFGFSTLFWLVVNTPWDIASHGYTLEDGGILLLFALVSILIPHSLFASALKILEASTVGIITTMEPICAIVIAFLVLGETLDLVQIVGAVAVVLAVTLLQMPAARAWAKNRRIQNAR